MEVITLISSPNFQEKQVGYLAAAVLFKNTDKLFTLIVNSMRNDVIGGINILEYNIAQGAVKDAKGSIGIFRAGAGVLTYLLSLKDEVTKICIAEDNEDRYELTKYVSSEISKETGKEIKVIKTSYEEFIKEQSSECGTIMRDCWDEGDLAYEEYKKALKLEVPDKTYIYLLEDGLIDMARSNILQYISAKLGTESYQNYFRTIAPDIYKILEADNDTINNPSQLDYYLSHIYGKKLLKALAKT